MSKIKGGGLKPRVKSKKDFSLAGVFGTPALADIPTDDFVIEPQFWKDQGELDDCTGNAVAEVSEDEEGIELSEEFQFYLTKVLVEKSPSTWGANLMDACLSSVNYGSIPKQIAYEFLKNPKDRAEILNPATWPDHLLAEALQYKKGSVFTIDYPYDTFTALRAALYAHREALTGKKMTIVVGSTWYEEWTNSTNGIIPTTYSTPVGGHAFKICGQKTIGEDLYLVAQLSNGRDLGDQGYFYFPSDVVNREFGSFGQFMLLAMPKDQAKYLHENSIAAADPWYLALIKAFINFFKLT